MIRNLAIFLILVALPVAAAITPVTVGTQGNEPLVFIAPDGTIYISALQHLYKSMDGGKTYTKVVTPIFANEANVASDSSMSMDPGGRLYFSFDHPYAGATAVCTTDDRGLNWFCNPVCVPGVTDRMWVLAPKNDAAYLVTNEGLYQTVFLKSTDRGVTWTSSAVGSEQLEPQSGELIQKPGSPLVLQSIKTQSSGLSLYVYTPNGTGTVLSGLRPTGLPNPMALPNIEFSRDGVLWAASEERVSGNGLRLVVSRSTDEGLTWTKLPPLPHPGGTSTFSWIATDSPGHVGIVYYHNPNTAASSLNITGPWSVRWIESHNALSANPTWTTTVIEENVHQNGICIAAGCSGTNRFAGDFISAAMLDDIPTLSWQVDGPPVAVHAVTLRYPVSLGLAAASAAAGEADGNASFTVTRSGGLNGTVSVHYATTGGTATPGADYTAAEGDLTFATGETSKTITIPITDDGDTEDAETVVVTLSSPTGATLDGISTATLTIADNDINVPTPAITSISPSSACQGGGDIVVTILGSNFTANSLVRTGAAARPMTFVSGGELRTTITAAERLTAGTITLRVDNGGVLSNEAPFTVGADATAPVVSAPVPITVLQTACDADGRTGVRVPSNSLSAFLNSGSATEECSSAVRLAVQSGGSDVGEGTFFAGGTTPVTFRFTDAAGNIGTATSSVTVRLFGDASGDAAVAATDLVLLANYLVGNINPGEGAFLAPIEVVDLNGDGSVNAVDIVIEANYLVGNVSCLAR